MNKNKKIPVILIAIFSLMAGYSVSAQSRAVSNPAAATKKSAKSKSAERTNKTGNKGKVKKKIDDDVIRNGDTIVLPMRYYGVSERLSDLARRNLPPVSIENGKQQEFDPKEVLLDQPESNVVTEDVPPAPIQTETLAPLAATPGVSFEGLGLGLAGGFAVTSAPPDTTMAVGPNHIVAWVNSQYAVFNKSGTKLLGPVNGNALFTGVGGVCDTTNRGDPILQYDRLADRWFLSQFAFSSGLTAPYLQCIAVSTTNNPTGTYFRYSISFGSVSPDGLNDYGKLGIWNDAYYTAYNVFGGSPAGGFTGVALCASDRTKMLAGLAATTLCAPTAVYAGGGSFLPADIDGTAPPTDTTRGGVFMRLRTGTPRGLRIVRLKPDFVGSTVTLTDGFGGATGSSVDLPVTVTLACNDAAGTCVAQPGTTTKLDTLADRLMYRLAYRNRGGVDSLVVTHSVDPDVGGPRSSALAWYEVRNPLGNPNDPTVSLRPFLNQNAVFDPGAASDRWMGSIAMNKFGAMLIGYSIANAGTGLKPSIAVAGRHIDDALNTLQTESIAVTGTGSQTVNGPNPLTRWGDYSTMQIDPADDETFWYTTQYLSADGAFNWHTRIVSYKFNTTTAIADGDFNTDSNWNNGKPTAAKSGIVPNGRTITVSTPSTAGDLNINAGGNLVMNANLNVAGVLTLGTKVDTGANTLALGCTASISGASATNYIIGNLKKDFCGVQPFTFPTGTTNGFSPVNTNVTVLATNPSSLTIKANQGNRAGMSSTQSLQRFWTLTETGDLTTNLTFNYLDPTDVVGTESSYALYRFVGSTGLPVTPFTLNTAANTISTNGVTAFSDWTVGSLAPLAAGVSAAGRVTAFTGGGIANASVTFTNPQGETFVASTTQNGKFVVEGMSAGETYIVTIAAKRFRFAPQVLTLNSNLTNVTFTSQP